MYETNNFTFAQKKLIIWNKYEKFLIFNLTALALILIVNLITLLYQTFSKLYK